jgi:uncharacterized protein YkwD
MKLAIARMYLALALSAFAVAAAAGNDAGYLQRLAALVNAYRASKGLPVLILDTTIAGLAREHSAAMAEAGQMNHDGFPSRARRSGLALCVENVGWNYRSPESQFEGWRDSPAHNRNLLDPRVERMGIGTVAAYVTMIACGR